MIADDLLEYAKKQYQDCQVAIAEMERRGVNARAASRDGRQLTFTRGASTAYEDIIRRALTTAAPGSLDGDIRPLDRFRHE